jgi:hypothetical protein
MMVQRTKVCQDGRMTSPQARTEPLSRTLVITAAIALLDDLGEDGLTFRSLAMALQTGHGAIQRLIVNRGQLLDAAASAVLAGALTTTTRGSEDDPEQDVIDVSSGFYDAVDAHPWLAGQLVAAPWQSATVDLWERLGDALQRMHVPDDALFTAVATLAAYTVGVANQNATNTRTVGEYLSRGDAVDAVADRWLDYDEQSHPFVHRVVAQLREHDDRKEFLKGLDIVLDGLHALHS